jgi:amidase
VVRSPGSNVVDTEYTTVAQLAKHYLGSAAIAADGMHDRLRRTAAAFLGRR